MVPSTTHLWRHPQQLICSKPLRGRAIIRWWRQSLRHYRAVTRLRRIWGSLGRGVKAFWVVTACTTETARSFGGDMFLRNVGHSSGIHGVTIHTIVRMNIFATSDCNQNLNTRDFFFRKVASTCCDVPAEMLWTEFSAGLYCVEACATCGGDYRFEAYAIMFH
jgi:hypothetical protein